MESMRRRKETLTYKRQERQDISYRKIWKQWSEAKRQLFKSFPRWKLTFYIDHCHFHWITWCHDNLKKKRRKKEGNIRIFHLILLISEIGGRSGAKCKKFRKILKRITAFAEGKKKSADLLGVLGGAPHQNQRSNHSPSDRWHSMSHIPGPHAQKNC